jgi:hypothetical protein
MVQQEPLSAGYCHIAGDRKCQQAEAPQYLERRSRARSLGSPGLKCALM